MARVRMASGGTVTAGLAASKGKYWEARYLALREYEAFSIERAGRYWHPRAATSGPLLPYISKGTRTEVFPVRTEVVAAELNPSIFGQGWQLADGQEFELLEVAADPHFALEASTIPLRIIDPANSDEQIWAGGQSLVGRFTSRLGDIVLSRGAGQIITVGELLTLNPPTAYLLVGNTVFGGMIYPAVDNHNYLPAITYSWVDWGGTDIKKESKAPNRSDTIHDKVEVDLTSAESLPGTQCWVLCNDGAGEIADHLVIEVPPQGRPRLELWHSKYAATSTPSVRVDDMQVVTQQAAKSRRHFTDRELWSRLGRRLTGSEQPALRLVSGSEDNLLALCGLDPDREAESLADRAPSLKCLIVVVQPGLSISKLRRDLESGTQSAT